MNKPKIAVIGLKGLPAFGGAASVGENIIEQLKSKYDFTVYAVASHTNKHGNYNGYYQKVFRNFPIKKLNILVYYIKSMFHCLIMGNYDLIHIHHIDGAFILPLLRLKYKIIATSHGRTQLIGKWPKYVNFFLGINELLMLKLSSQITCVGNPLAVYYQVKGYKNISYIPNGISLSQSIDKSELPYSEYILFAAGRIIPLKGCHILLEALHLMNYKGKVLVIGDLDQIPSYKEELLRLSVNLNVEFIPIIKEKAILLNFVQKAKLFVFPSDYENMSMMLLEVAYTKTPLICSDIPANKAIFSEKEVLFFETNNPVDLSQKISYAMEHQELLKEMKEKAFQLLATNYNWNHIAESYDAIFERYINS